VTRRYPRRGDAALVPEAKNAIRESLLK